MRACNDSYHAHTLRCLLEFRLPLRNACVIARRQHAYCCHSKQIMRYICKAESWRHSVVCCAHAHTSQEAEWLDAQVEACRQDRIKDEAFIAAMRHKLEEAMTSVAAAQVITSSARQAYVLAPGNRACTSYSQHIIVPRSICIH